MKSSYLHSVDIYKVRISAQYRYLLCVDIYPAARRTGASSSELVGARLRSSAPAPLPAAALLLGSARPQHSPPRCLFIITLKSGLLCLCNTNSASQLKILGALTFVFTKDGVLGCARAQVCCQFIIMSIFKTNIICG